MVQENRSGTSAAIREALPMPSVTLPKGGGAIRGIGEHAHLPLHPFEMAIRKRRRHDLADLLHHSARRVQSRFDMSSQHCHTELRCNKADRKQRIHN
jgi:hypothetical protein